jgi:hypothetical protein
LRSVVEKAGFEKSFLLFDEMEAIPSYVSLVAFAPWVADVRELVCWR